MGGVGEGGRRLGVGGGGSNILSEKFARLSAWYQVRTRPECPLGRRVNHYTTGAAVKTEEGDTTWSYFRNLRLAAVCR